MSHGPASGGHDLNARGLEGLAGRHDGYGDLWVLGLFAPSLRPLGARPLVA